MVHTTELQKPWITASNGDEIFNPDIFERAGLNRYRKLHEGLWHNLVVAHSSMYVLKEVMEYPANLFVLPHENIFFSLLKRNFFCEIVLIVHNALEGTRKSLTVKNLKEFLEQAVKDKSRTAVQDYLVRLISVKDVENILKRLRVLRDKYVAHLDLKLFQDPANAEGEKLDIRELQTLLDLTTKLINGLSLEGGMHMAYYGGDKQNSDIYKFLTTIAAETALLRMPEEQRDLWSIYKDKLTDEGKRTFNLWRKRIGRSEIAF